jgi:hypothetical protein
MALEAMVLAAMPLEALSREATNEQQQSPVDVVVNIRKDLAEFQQNSSKQALRKAMREACEEAFLRTAGHIDIDPVVEYLKERGVIRSGSKRTKRTKRTGETAGRSSRRLA